MSSLIHSKRRQEEAFGDSVLPTRIIKRPQPEQTNSDSQPPPTEPCLLDLPAGVIATVGKFMDTRTRPADLMAICIVFGSDVARTVRKSYLENNLHYLEEISDFANNVAMGAANGHFDRRPSDYQTGVVKIRTRLQEWMSENGWWKCAAKLMHHERSAESGFPGLPVIFKTMELKVATEEERDKLETEYLTISPSGHADLYDYQPSSESTPFDIDYSIVHSVNGTVCTSFEQAKHLILEEGSDKTLQMTHHAFAEIFFNPAVIIDLGLLNVLKYQIEEMKVDVNYQNFAGLIFRGPKHIENFCEGMPLIMHALVQTDDRILQYLLSVEASVNPTLQHSFSGGQISDLQVTLLHQVPTLASYPLLTQDIDLMQRLRCILEHGKIDVNPRAANGSTPLEVLCHLSKFSRRNYDFARLLLSFGAEVTEGALSELNDKDHSDKEGGTEDDNLGDGARYYRPNDILILLTTTQKMRQADAS